MKKFIPLLLTSLLWHLPVLAQDKFEGPYGGIAIGYIDAKDHGKEIEFLEPSTWEQKNEPNGASISANLGFNKVLDNKILIGIEGSLEKNFSSDKVYQEEFGTIDSCCTVKSDLKESAYIGGRLGKIFNDDTLVYLSAGRAFKHIKRNFKDTSVPESHTDKLWQSDWYYGAGLEKYLNDHLSLVFDYKRVDLGERTYYGIPNWGIEKHDYKENNFKIGINYHF